MSEVTLEQVRAKQDELAALIDRLAHQKPAQPIVLRIPEADIELQPGDHYAGTVLDEDGRIKHHLVLLAAKPENDLDWTAAKAWAESAGGELPTRQEAALLFANCRPHLEERWHWTADEYEGDASSAWLCSFLTGLQSYGPKSYEGRARAVRRVNP